MQILSPTAAAAGQQQQQQQRQVGWVVSPPPPVAVVGVCVWCACLMLCSAVCYDLNALLFSLRPAPSSPTWNGDSLRAQHMSSDQLLWSCSSCVVCACVHCSVSLCLLSVCGRVRGLCCVTQGFRLGRLSTQATSTHSNSTTNNQN